MFKSILLGGAACALMVGTLSPSAFAQSTAPSPAATTPQTQVSPAEVQQFASAIKELRSLQETARGQVGQVVQQSGMTPERFNQILQSQQTLATPPTPTVSAAEQQTFNQVLAKVDQIKTETRQQMEQAIQKQGLQVPRFNQILAMVRQDEGLRQQVQQVLGN